MGPMIRATHSGGQPCTGPDCPTCKAYLDAYADDHPRFEVPPASDHWRKLKPEPVEVIEAWGLGWHLGTALKYIARAGTKPGIDTDLDTDLAKAVWYIERYRKLKRGELASTPGGEHDRP